MNEKLIVKAEYGELKYEAEATPYISNAHQEQYDSCIADIHQQMKNAGRYEMKDAFSYSANQLESRSFIAPAL